jgi:prepilin-type N-terminal cleavage/methylation domain-containing protein
MKIITRLQGFTLIELLITIAVAGILLAVAAPNFSNLISGNNARSSIERLTHIFAYARSEAVSRASDVEVCASTDGVNCVNPGTDADWGNQWLVRSDAGVVLRVESINALSVNFAVTNNAVPAVDLDAFISVCFNSLGEECNSTLPFVVFTATSNGQTSFIRLNRNGSVGL